MTELTPQAAANRAVWDEQHSGWYGGRAERLWTGEPCWGLWERPETELGVFPALDGRDLVELGCGTGYVSAWAARRGARPVGVDNSSVQLATARALQEAHGPSFPLVHASAEQVPLPDACCDVVISEHGAIGWCDPELWIPEAARLLRPGGQLIFLRNSTLLTLCDRGDEPVGTTLVRGLAELPRLAQDDGSVNYQLPTGAMIGLLRRCGLVVDELTEIVVPADSLSEFDYVTADWASRWPSEELWKATLTG